MKLFMVTTTVKQFKGCKDVHFSWFYDGERKNRPYAGLIKNYDPTDEYAVYVEDCIDEMFTAIEANALKEYLDRVHGHEGTTTIKRAKLPIRSNVIGTGARAVGGGDDFYTLYKETKYSLPFKVRGYFNLRGCELLDGSGRFRPSYLWVAGFVLRFPPQFVPS